MRKYVSLGSALMMGAVLGKETKLDIKPIFANKQPNNERVYLQKPRQHNIHHKQEARDY